MTGGGAFFTFALSLAMLAAFALAAGGVLLIVKRGEWKRGLLMVGVGIVLVLNVLIWTLPIPARS